MLAEILSHLATRGGANLKELSKLTGVHRNYLRYYLDALVDLQIIKKVGTAYIPSAAITWKDPRKLRIKKEVHHPDRFSLVETQEDYEHELATVVVREDEVTLSFWSDSGILISFEEPILSGTVGEMWDILSKMRIQGDTQGIATTLLGLQGLTRYPHSRVQLVNPTEMLIEIPFPRGDKDPERAVEILEDQLKQAVTDLTPVGFIKYAKVAYEE